MTRKEKIELLKKLKAGELNVIAGQVIGAGCVLTQSGEGYFLNGQPVSLEEIEKVVDTLVILPERE